MIAFVLTLSFVCALAFRSIAIPLTAIAVNLLSVGAAYGLLVLVFQKGVGADLLGFTQVERIDAWVPIFLFSVLFGLSMDYQVFLLSRIHERWSATGDTAGAIVHGVASTARLITGAAAIIIVVFAGFATGQLVAFQEMGFGIAVALALDATLVRLLLIPAAMRLLGSERPRQIQPCALVTDGGERLRDLVDQRGELVGLARPDQEQTGVPLPSLGPVAGERDEIASVPGDEHPAVRRRRDQHLLVGQSGERGLRRNAAHVVSAACEHLADAPRRQLLIEQDPHGPAYRRASRTNGATRRHSAGSRSFSAIWSATSSGYASR